MKSQSLHASSTAQQRLLRQHVQGCKLHPVIRLRRPFVSKQGTQGAVAHNIWALHGSASDGGTSENLFYLQSKLL